MHLELGTSCIYYWRLLHIARESYHLCHLELNYYLPPAKFDFKPLLERLHKTQQQKEGRNSALKKKLDEKLSSSAQAAAPEGSLGGVLCPSPGEQGQGGGRGRMCPQSGQQLCSRGSS